MPSPPHFHPRYQQMDPTRHLVPPSARMAGHERFCVGHCIHLSLRRDELCACSVPYLGEERGSGGVRHFEKGEGDGDEVGKDCSARCVHFGL